MSRRGVAAIVALLVAGCTPGWPFPGVSMDMSGLGVSPIARTIADPWPLDDGPVVLRLQKLLAENGPPTRSSLEALGAVCDVDRSTTCRYHGRIDMWFHGGAGSARDQRQQQRIDVSFGLTSTPVGIALSRTMLLVDASGLPESALSSVVLKTWADDEAAIAATLRRRVEDQRPWFGVTPGYLESLGARCEAVRTTTCSYVGAVQYRTARRDGDARPPDSRQVEVAVAFDIAVTPVDITVVRRER